MRLATHEIVNTPFEADIIIAPYRVYQTSLTAIRLLSDEINTTNELGTFSRERENETKIELPFFPTYCRNDV